MNSSDTHSSPPVALSALILLAHYHGISANPADILHRYAAAGDLSQTEWLPAANFRQAFSRLNPPQMPV